MYNAQSGKKPETSLELVRSSRAQDEKSQGNKKPAIENVFSPTVTGDYTPEQIIAIARLHGIPIRSDPNMTKILAKADPSSEIPSDLPNLAAEIVLWAKRLESGEKKTPKSKKAA